MTEPISITIPHEVTTAVAFFTIGYAVHHARHYWVIWWDQTLCYLRSTAELNRARQAFQRRPRGKIVKVGHIIRDQFGREHPDGFEINCPAHVPVESYGPDGEFCRGGYTHAELVEIAKRGKEFHQ